MKAQVDVGGQGKAGGVLFAEAQRQSRPLRSSLPRYQNVPVRSILVEERLLIEHEYYVSIAVDRSSRQPVILFADAGGVEIESTASAVRRVIVSPLLRNIPPFLMRELLGDAPKELAPTINSLYRVFQEKDAMLAEINPLVTTPQGVYAADAKLIIDDNALARQGIAVNRDLSAREREAEKHGFSYVAGREYRGHRKRCRTHDVDARSHRALPGRAANFLDVGGGADQERVMHAVRLVASMPGVNVIVVNLLGGITRCDEVARGIIAADVEPTIIVRMAGTNEEEGRQLLAGNGYRMLESMDAAVRAAMEVAP